MYKKYLFSLLILVAMPTLLFAQRSKQRVYVMSPKEAHERYERGCDLYGRTMYAAAILELEAALQDLEDPLSKEKSKFYIAHSRSILQQKYSNQILEEYIASCENEFYRSDAKVLLADNYLLLERKEKAGEILSGVKPSQLTAQYQLTYKYLKAYMAMEDGDLDEARPLFADVSRSDNHHAPDAVYYLGYIAYLKGEYREATEAFEKSKAQGARFPKTDAYLAQIHFAQGDYAYVIQNQERLLRIDRDPAFLAEIHWMIALSYYNSKDYASTIEHMGKFEKLGGDMGREGHYTLGYSYYMMNNYSKAVDEMVQVVGDDALAQNAYYHLGDAYIKVGNKAGALQAFAMAADLSYDAEMQEDAMYNYAKLTYEIDQSPIYTNKIDVLMRYYNAYPESKYRNEISGYLLNLYINSGDNVSAMAIAEKVKNPSGEVRRALQRTYFEQGLLLYQNKEFAEAKKMFERSREYGATPKYTALSLFWIAECRYAQGEYNTDVIWQYKQYQAAAQPSILEYQMADYGIAYTYFNMKEYGYAITWFNSFLKDYTGDDQELRKDAYARLGDSWFARRDYAKASENYGKALKTGPDDYVEYQRAITYGMSGDNTTKIKELKGIMDAGESQYYEAAIMELTSTYLKIQRFSEAKSTALYMMNNLPNSTYYPQSMVNLAAAEANMGNNSAAIEAYKRVVREFPRSEEAKGALTALQSIYVSQGDVEPYFAFLKSVGRSSDVDAGDKERLTFEAVQNLYAAKQFERARQEGVKYINSCPNGLHLPDVTYYVADSAERLGDDTAAMRYYEEIAAMSQNAYSVEASSKIVDIAIRKKDYKRAYGALQAVISGSTDPSARRAALERSMGVAIDSGEKSLIRDAYRAVLAASGMSAEAFSLAWFAYGKDMYGQADYRKAIENLGKMNLSRQNAYQMEGLYLIADSYYNLGDYNKAEESVMKLAKGDSPHQSWVAKGFILLGDSYLKRNDKFQARATYQSVVDGYTNDSDGIKATARGRLKDLEK